MSANDNSHKDEIMSILNSLKGAKKDRLAKCIEANWDKKALDYSKELNTFTALRPMEKELLNAFSREMERIEAPEDIKVKTLASLQKRRVIQTGPHLGVTLSPRMLCINWLDSLGVAEEDFDVVGMFSGIPFSNQSRPGRINRKADSINLFPSSMQDALVYRSLIPEKLVDTIQGLPKELQKFRELLPRAVVGGSYTKWALNGCENIQKKILGKENLVFLDINEVVTNYLLQVLQNREHIMYKIFFDPAIQKEFVKAFPNEIMFYSPTMDGNFESMENLILLRGELKGQKKNGKQIYLVTPESLIKELRDGRLCPALLTGFLALAFLNEFKCFGSFAQVEYLPVYQEKLAKLKFLKEYAVEKVPTSNLTTGSFPQKDLYPADIIINNYKFSPNKEILFGELLVPMKEKLLESYFTGIERKNGKK